MKKKVWLTVGIIALVILILLLLLRSCNVQEPATEKVPPETVQEDISPYKSPIDFAALQKKNPDVYAYLDIPGTDISYPVVQSAEDDTFYMNHDSDGNKYAGGALFTEHIYNSNDFTDLLTVIYGHRMNNGSMFGALQKTFSDAEEFQKHREFILYLPEGELHYEIFAALPCDNRHIPYTYAVAADYGYSGAEAFLEMVYESRTLDTNFSEGEKATVDDHIVVLSTCQKANRKNRYLVMGRLIEESSVLPGNWVS